MNHPTKMSLQACSQYTSCQVGRTTLLVPSESGKWEPWVGSILYDEKSNFQKVRAYTELDCAFPPINAYHIDNALLTNEFIIHRDGVVFVDSSIYSATYQGAREAEILSAFAGAIQRADEVIDEQYADISGMVFHNEGGGTWGHFIVQNIPRALLFLQKFPNGKILVPKSHFLPNQSNFNRALTRLGIPQECLIPLERTGSYRFRELVLVDFLFDLPNQICHPLAKHLLETPFQSDFPLDPKSSSADRIFIDRPDGFGRTIANRDHVEEIFRKHGFQRIVLSEKSFETQVDIWRRAKLVASTLGSDLTNLIFGNPGTRLMVLSPDWFSDSFFYHLSIQKEMQWNELRCGEMVEKANIPHRSSFKVDPSILDTMLASLTRRPC